MASQVTPACRAERSPGVRRGCASLLAPPTASRCWRWSAGRPGWARPAWSSSWPPPPPSRGCGCCAAVVCRWARRACRSRRSLRRCARPGRPAGPGRAGRGRRPRPRGAGPAAARFGLGRRGGYGAPVAPSRSGAAVRAAARGGPAAGLHRAAAVGARGPALGRPLHPRPARLPGHLPPRPTGAAGARRSAATSCTGCTRCDGCYPS